MFKIFGKNKLFGNVKEVYWISKIELSKDKEENIRDCFTDQVVKFDYPNNVEEFDDLLELFRLKKAAYIKNDLGENMVLGKVIVMDDVSGLGDKSDEFANCLTVSRKYGMTCVYIFHTVYPTRQNWQMIMSQTKIFNFFPGSVQASSIERILSSFASRYRNTYIPNQDIWINKLYFDISNSKLKQCLTIDTHDVNDLGPGKFRTQADSGPEQICYYNRNKKDTSFNSFLATRKETSPPSEINFSIVKVIDNVNKHDSINSDISDELSDFKNDIVQRTIQ